MHRIDAPGNVGGRFSMGNPHAQIPATQVDAAILNAFQEEIAGAIEASGQTLDKARWDQLTVAIQQLAMAGGGQLRALRDAALVSPALHYRNEIQGPICLVSTSHHTNPDTGVVAGVTSGPPSASNTVDANGYEGGADNDQDGHLWPYVAIFGARMLGDSSVNDGYFPMCRDGEGINHYVWPDFITVPGMFGMQGGEIRLVLEGQIEVDGASSDGYCVEVVLTRQGQIAWNSGDGGDGTGSPGELHVNRSISILSPVFNTGTGLGTPKLFRCEISMSAIFKRLVYVTSRWLIAPLSTSLVAANAPIVDDARMTTWTGPAALSFLSELTRWKVLLKVDGNDSTPEFPVRVVNNTPFGGAGSSPPLAPQDGTAIVCTVLAGRVDYYPRG